MDSILRDWERNVAVSFLVFLLGGGKEDFRAFYIVLLIM